MAKMALNIHVYSDVKAQRMVSVDGRRYVEGELINGLYLVESITPDGVVLSYQGERLLLQPNSNPSVRPAP